MQQRSFDDLGAALVDAEFCVFDLETTGGSPDACQITEIGAVKVRGGEVLGEFRTFVNPRVPIPPAITMLTGITDQMVADAEPIERVLPAFLEFAGGATLVAHNASFDTRFMQANLARHGYARMGNPVVCTVRLARRLVRDEVPNLRLATLARCLHARTAPTHRALDDARATTDVFHALLELAGRWGISHLDDLLWFQSARGHPSYAKVRLVEDLPRARGVYLFRDDRDRVLYVGKATDLRARVRGYFSGDERKRIDDLLREMHHVDHVVCATDLDASVLEARMIRRYAPPFNRAQRGRGTAWFVRLSDERYPRLVTSRTGGTLGPMSSRAAAAVRDALEDATRIRTCTPRIGPKTSFPACVRGQIGRCPSPCEGSVTPESYAPEVAVVARALAGDATDALAALEARMERLADESRFEEAADVRARIGAIVDALRAARAIRTLVAAGRLRIGVGRHAITISDGRIEEIDGRALPCDPDEHPDEPRLIAAWLQRHRKTLRILSCDRGFADELRGGALVAGWAARLRRLTVVRDPSRTRAPAG